MSWTVDIIWRNINHPFNIRLLTIIDFHKINYFFLSSTTHVICLFSKNTNPSLSLSLYHENFLLFEAFHSFWVWRGNGRGREKDLYFWREVDYVAIISKRRSHGNFLLFEAFYGLCVWRRREKGLNFGEVTWVVEEREKKLLYENV